MADNYNIYKKCFACNGTGLKLGDADGGPRDPSETCPECNGEKLLFWGEMKEEEVE